MRKKQKQKQKQKSKQIKIAIERISWLIQTLSLNCIALRSAKQSVRSAELGALVPVFEKSVIEPKPNLDAKTLI